MWILAANLPLIIGDKIPHGDEKWECFLLLLDIVQLCMGRVASPSLAGTLGTLIDDHHSLFCRCYPTSSVIPKMHYMVHLPQQMLRYRIHVWCMCICIVYYLTSTGPLISSWCMRMEGKNSYCKRIAQSSNFKNVPLTLTKWHHRWLCTYLQSARFFERELECGPGIVRYKTDMVYITGVDFVTAREPKKGILWRGSSCWKSENLQWNEYPRFSIWGSVCFKVSSLV